QMLASLNTNSGYTGTLGVRRQKCLVITKMPGKLRSDTRLKKEGAVSGQPLADLIADLNEMPNSLPLIVDESGFNGTVAADAKKAVTPEALKRVLLEAGLSITETERDLLMLELKDGPAENL